MDNQGRADRAAEAITHVYDNEEMLACALNGPLLPSAQLGRSYVTALLTDLRHLCELDGIDFDQCLVTSEIHFNEEQR